MGYKTEWNAWEVELEEEGSGVNITQNVSITLLASEKDITEKSCVCWKYWKSWIIMLFEYLKKF